MQNLISFAPLFSLSLLLLLLGSNTQIYASLGTIFPDGAATVAAFTVFQFLQNIGSAVGFFYSPHVPVHGPNGTIAQLSVLAGMAALGTLLFFLVRLQPRARAE